MRLVAALKGGIVTFEESFWRGFNARTKNRNPRVIAVVEDVNELDDTWYKQIIGRAKRDGNNCNVTIVQRKGNK